MSNLDLQLSHLDFDKNQEINPSPAMSDSGFRKKTPEFSSSEGSRPGSFHALLSQNEDLAARLRVTLQRLAQTEEENETLKDSFETANSKIANIEDQLLIWKEKEKVWKQREFQLEKNQNERERELDIESSLLRQKAEQFDKLEEKLSRYQKYQEKIKTTVKPYIAQLKSYTESLLEQTRSLNHALLQQEVVTHDLQTRLNLAKAEADNVGAKAELDKNQLIGLFEDERASLRGEIESLLAQNEILQEKTRVLDRSMERQDELENLVVALRRTKEDMARQFHQETMDLRQILKEREADLAVKSLQVVDFKNEVQQLKSTLEQLTNSSAQTEEQLTSLRYMWTQKTQEAEKLRLTVQSLEKINLELSQKLNSLRQNLEIS
jgi:chromosome segregation ATPase